MTHDWPTLHKLCQEVLVRLGSTEFVRAIITKDGMTLVPKGDEPVFLAEFYCRNGDAMAAHFAACILNHVGLGEFRSLRTLLSVSDQLIAFRIGSEIVVGAQLRCK